MRLLLLCLTFACGSALAGELFQSIPTVLSAKQVSAQEDYHKATGFKTIATIRIDQTLLNLDSHILTLTVNGKSYRLASIHQHYDRPTTDPGRRLKFSTWSSQSTDDSGRLRISDDGRVAGDFTLDGRIYRVMSGDGVDFLLESDEPAPVSPELFQPIVPVPTLTAAQVRMRDSWAKRPEVISITPVKVDKTAVKSNTITMIVKGRRYHFDGDWKRTDPHPINTDKGTEMSPGSTFWSGDSWDGTGTLGLSDHGGVHGNFTITRYEGRGRYLLMGTGDMAFLIEHKEFQFKK